ncbi:MAG: hypothetical protein GY941_28695 [Planctomycetes bacterium]|nr:hypothetical protein [Planctomycetota bacterium]
MKRFILMIVMGLFFTTAAQAADVVGQRYIDQLTRGGAISIKRAAQSIYNTGEKDTEVLDVASEILLQRYPTAGIRDIDALAWVCRGLGNSRNGRYHSTLKEVVDSNSHEKLRKYAKIALKQVGKADGKQYVKGSVNIAALRKTGQKAKPKKIKKAKKENSSGKQSLDIIREGMSMEEVYDLVGQPTATTIHQTGKAWIPFNYGAKDLARTILLYEGQGRVVCSHDGYSSTSRVMEVIIDPDETGYP